MAYVAKVTAGGNTGMLIGSSLYGTCTSEARTAQKDVTMSGFDTLITGVTVHVKFTNGNTIASPTLKVGSTAAKAIKMYGTTDVGRTKYTSWYDGAVVSFTYDGTNWVMNDYHRNSYVIVGQKSGASLGTMATAEGNENTASGYASHAEGSYTTASNTNAHAEGNTTTASGSCSHAEGNTTTASGTCSHAEGSNTTASGEASHAEGSDNTASGTSSHAEGYQTAAKSAYSHAEGRATIASTACQHVFGKYNVSSSTHTEIVGWGVATKRENIRTLTMDGNEWIAGTLTQASDARLKDVRGEVPDLSEIRAVRFRWNDVKGTHDDKDHIGYIAQEVEKIAPYLVGDDSNGYKSLDYIALLCAKVEMLEREVEELKQNKNV